ncbi:hypothetical protein C1752_01539 [Acaryochloris thomasi RCC1774]|uniref:Polymerase nucleotidyl transferase domain-containing protein n=1 Tax=Acaryochloris thomasi RCC1774 TaxID=1764569 RepID=A0A2W1JKR9_9CYAN|nr:nucleotidyltransferase domain-containing protein [Acaryochloris thomasi]PZD74003.1 hypothetical protein C1752_01539 [Acaryochloris thomasi RCC1774]
MAIQASSADLNQLIWERLQISESVLAGFCDRWMISELSLFGSVLRNDFRADSDVDILVCFASGDSWSLLDWVRMKDELERLFGRQVDVAEKEQLTNPYRRAEIMRTHKVIYASR